MLNSKNVKEKILSLIINDNDTPFIVGHGILNHQIFYFDKEKLEASKKDIVMLLDELGIVGHSLINLTALTTTKDDQVWNSLEAFEDFEALNLLLACFDACEFVINNSFTIQSNLNQLGIENSTLLNTTSRILLGNDRWLEEIRNIVMNKMCFLVEEENINSILSNNKNTGIQYIK